MVSRKSMIWLLAIMLLLVCPELATAAVIKNTAPVIKGVTASKVSLLSEERILLTSTVYDKERDRLTYQWIQLTKTDEPGTLSAANAVNSYWTAPAVATETKVLIQLKVTDAKRAVAIRNILVTIKPKPLSQLFNELKPSVVRIQTDTGQGSGFVTSANGNILTNYHVIKGSRKGEVYFSNGVHYPIESIIKLNINQDWAIIHINAQNLKPLKNSKTPPKTGDTAFTIGNPLGLGWSISSGIISDNARDLDGQKVIQTTTPVSPGNSGGPLFDLRGRVTGIVVSQLLNAQNINFAIPITTVDFSAKDLINQSMFNYFNHDSIMSRIDDLVDYLNEQGNPPYNPLQIDDNTDLGNVKYENGTWDDDGTTEYALDIVVDYDQFAKIYLSHSISNGFTQHFYESSYYFNNLGSDYGGTNSFGVWYRVIDELPTQPAEVIPARGYKYENGKYKVDWYFYESWLDNGKTFDDYWYTDEK